MKLFLKLRLRRKTVACLCTCLKNLSEHLVLQSESSICPKLCFSLYGVCVCFFFFWKEFELSCVFNLWIFGVCVGGKTTWSLWKIPVHADTSQNMKLTHRDPNNETKCARLHTGLDLISHIISLFNINLTTWSHFRQKKWFVNSTTKF